MFTFNFIIFQFLPQSDRQRIYMVVVMSAKENKSILMSFTGKCCFINNGNTITFLKYHTIIDLLHGLVCWLCPVYKKKYCQWFCRSTQDNDTTGTRFVTLSLLLSPHLLELKVANLKHMVFLANVVPNEFNVSFIIVMGENVPIFTDDCRTITPPLHLLKIIYSYRKTTSSMQISL